MSGLFHPPKVAPTGDAKIDKLIEDYNKAMYLMGASKNGHSYIKAAVIETPPGWRGPCVRYTRGDDRPGIVLLKNFEAWVESITSLTDISIFDHISFE